MISAFYNWLISSLRLLQMKNVPQKGTLILTYGKILLRNQINRLRKIERHKESFLGFQMEFFSYQSFLYLYEEIFMQQGYHFDCNTTEPTVVDCGCNVGMSILYVKWLYPKAHIVGFEPDPATFKVLQSNIRRNGLKNIELHNVAITDREGPITFYKDSKEDGSPMMGMHLSRGISETQTVPGTSLAPYLNSPVNLLKMDIEGAEALCMRDIDGKNSLQYVQKIIMECHHNIQEQPILSEILPVLEKNKFKYQLSANLRPPYPENTSQDIMIYAYRDLVEGKLVGI